MQSKPTTRQRQKDVELVHSYDAFRTRGRVVGMPPKRHHGSGYPGALTIQEGPESQKGLVSGNLVGAYL